LNEALTCGQLYRLSNQVAHSLIANGVTRGDRVGIYLYKSPAAIAAIFGIMKTGECYVPVDANAPGPRLEEIGRQCRRSCRRSGDSKSAISPPFTGFSLPVKFFRPSTCGRWWKSYHTLAIPTFADRPKRMFAPTMRSNLFRRNKRRRSRSAKLAQILTSFRSTQKGKESSRPTNKAFFTREDPPLCKVLRPPWALRGVFHPQPLYRGQRQPTMDAGLVFDAWVSYGRCDLAHENRPMPKLESQKFLNGPGFGMEGA